MNQLHILAATFVKPCKALQQGVPEVQHLLAMAFAFSAVEVGPDDRNQQVTKHPSDPQSKQPGLSCHLRWWSGACVDE